MMARTNWVMTRVRLMRRIRRSKEGPADALACSYSTRARSDAWTSGRLLGSILAPSRTIGVAQLNATNASGDASTNGVTFALVGSVAAGAKATGG